MKTFSVSGIKITAVGSRVTLACGSFTGTPETFLASGGALECGDAVKMFSNEVVFRVLHISEKMAK
jgi:hypothetical protein